MKEITFRPAFDKRNHDPNKNYGIHGVEMRWLYGDKEKGVVQFLVFTNWHLPHVRAEGKVVHNNKPFEYWQEPMPADLGYHSPTPQYEGQPKQDGCDCLNQDFCYYDGSGLNAEPIFETLISEGSDAVWSKLEAYHKELFP